MPSEVEVDAIASQPTQTIEAAKIDDIPELPHHESEVDTTVTVDNVRETVQTPNSQVFPSVEAPTQLRFVISLSPNGRVFICYQHLSTTTD